MLKMTTELKILIVLLLSIHFLLHPTLSAQIRKLKSWPNVLCIDLWMLMWESAILKKKMGVKTHYYPRMKKCFRPIEFRGWGCFHYILLILQINSDALYELWLRVYELSMKLYGWKWSTYSLRRAKGFCKILFHSVNCII